LAIGRSALSLFHAKSQSREERKEIPVFNSLILYEWYLPQSSSTYEVESVGANLDLGHTLPFLLFPLILNFPPRSREVPKKQSFFIEYL
jgi:hypothetical protein